MDNVHINPDKIIELVIAYLPKLALAIITLVAGLWLIRIFVKGILKLMQACNCSEVFQKPLKQKCSIRLKPYFLKRATGGQNMSLLHHGK